MPGARPRVLLLLLLLAAAAAASPEAAQACPAARGRGMPPPPLASFAFEVFGRVQGVYFRAHTVDRADALGLVGWVRNTARGTVEGAVQGERAALAALRAWLETTGSPQSSVERVVITGERGIARPEFEGFARRPTV
jgi:acylphosphatase